MSIIQSTIFGNNGYPKTFKTSIESLDFGLILANSQSSLSITLTGVTTDNYVVLSNPSSILTAGLTYNTYITAANTITIRLTNTTSSMINPSVTDWNIMAIKL